MANTTRGVIRRALEEVHSVCASNGYLRVGSSDRCLQSGGIDAFLLGPSVEVRRTVAGVRAPALEHRAAALLGRLIHHCDIVETRNDSWRFKSREDDHATRTRLVSAIPVSADEPSATSKTRGKLD